MNDKQRFDAAVKKVLSVSKQQLKERMEAEKRTPKPSASRVPGASGSR
jgi:hypothetical protein